MPRQRIPDLGSVGLLSDMIPSLTPPAAWTNMINCSTNDGSIQSARGERKLFDLQIKPIYHTAYKTPDGVWNVIVSDGVSVHSYDLINKVAKNITPAGTPWASGFISFANLNGVLVVNSASEGMFYWATGETLPADQILKPCPGWDTEWRCAYVCAYRYYLVALNMTESSVNYPHKFRWSNSAQEGDLPTEWIATLTNDAGDDILGESAGVIIGGAVVRDSLYIVKEDAIYGLSWIGGQYVMRTDQLKGGIGTRIARGFAPAMGGLIVFTTSDCLYFDGQNATSLVDMRIRRTLFNAISEELWDLSQVYVNGSASLIVISGVRAGALNLSDSYVYNYEEKTWGHRRLVNSYGYDTILVTDATSTLQWDQLGTPALPKAMPMFVPGVSWDQQTDGTWNKGVYQPSVPDTIVYESNDTDTAWWVSVIVEKNTDWNDQPKYCMAERIGIPVGGADGLVMITEVWPEMVGTATVNISIGSQMSEGETAVWDGPHPFTPGVSKSITPRLTGRFMAFRIESQFDGNWRLGALTYNIQPAGER
jgi:hypothetical protein